MCVCVFACVCVCVCVHADVSVNKRLDTVKLPKTTGVRGYCCLNQELNLQPLISCLSHFAKHFATQSLLHEV